MSSKGGALLDGSPRGTDDWMERSRRVPFASRRLPAFNLSQKEERVEMSGVVKARWKIVKVFLWKEVEEGARGKIERYWERLREYAFKRRDEKGEMMVLWRYCNVERVTL